jgi:hypothetical protein
MRGGTEGAERQRPAEQYHAAVVGSEKEKTATFQLAPNGETWRN